MNVSSFLKKHKFIIVGCIVILTIITITTIVLLKSQNICNENQTLQTCNGKKVCLDNCKDGMKRCNPCDTECCCPNDHVCLGKSPNSNCCSQSQICINDTTTKEQTCCNTSQICDNGVCNDCPEGNPRCKNSQGIYTDCCDPQKEEECCGDDGCCPKENCINDSQGKKTCCDPKNNITINGQCCAKSQVYIDDNGNPACCPFNQKVCYNDKKAICCHENESCSDPGYCATKDGVSSTIKNKCIVDAKTIAGGPGPVPSDTDTKSGKFCVNKNYAISSFTDCNDDKSCNNGETCNTLYYRSKYNCNTSDDCNGLGLSGITSACYEANYDETNNSLTYTQQTCDSNNQNQIHSGLCGVGCGTDKKNAPLFCPSGVPCTPIEYKDKNGVLQYKDYTCSDTNTSNFSAPKYQQAQITLDNNKIINTCSQYYQVDSDKKDDDCLLYNNSNGNIETGVKPILHPNKNYYCPLFTEAASALPSNNVVSGPLIIASDGYKGYGYDDPPIPASPGPYYDKSGNRFGPTDQNILPIATAKTTTTSPASLADCKKQFTNLGVQYIVWEQGIDSDGEKMTDGGTCTAYYDCNNTNFMDTKDNLFNNVNNLATIPNTAENSTQWFGTVCQEHSNPHNIPIYNEKNTSVGSLAACVQGFV